MVDILQTLVFEVEFENFIVHNAEIFFWFHYNTYNKKYIKMCIRHITSHKKNTHTTKQSTQKI